MTSFNYTILSPAMDPKNGIDLESVGLHKATKDLGLMIGFDYPDIGYDYYCTWHADALYLWFLEKGYKGKIVDMSALAGFLGYPIDYTLFIREVGAEHHPDQGAGLMLEQISEEQLEREIVLMKSTLDSNFKGVRINEKLYKHLCNLHRSWEQKELQRFIDITGSSSPSTDAFKGWVKEALGITLPNVKVKTLKALGESYQGEDEIKAVLLSAPDITDGAMNRFDLLKTRVTNDYRIHDFVKYNATTTGRFAGRRFNVQSLPKAFLSEQEIYQSELSKVQTIKHSFRTLLVPNHGCRFISADYSGIEVRLAVWLCGSADHLKVMADGKDPYLYEASKILELPEEEVSPDQRLMGKVARLGGQYYLGWHGLKAYANQWGLKMSDQEAKRFTDGFYKANKELFKFYDKCYDACITTIQDGGLFVVGGIKILYRDHCLIIEKPSGTRLHYRKPVIHSHKGHRLMRYTNIHGQGKLFQKSHLANNIMQSMCADLLKDKIYDLTNAGFRVAFTVHDEFLIEVDEADESALERVNVILQEVPAWAEGLPLGIEGEYADTFQK